MKQRLKISKKTGFSANRPFNIYDEKGKLFYSSNFTNSISNGKRLFFNLPIGHYTIVGKINKLKFPNKQKRIRLPIPERNIPKKKLKIIFRNNPKKSTIFWDKNLIVFDKRFLNLPKYMLMDVYFHELGHRFFNSEHLADLYATKRMLEVGYNKSQIGRSVINTLGEYSNYRKILKVNSML